MQGSNQESRRRTTDTVIGTNAATEQQQQPDSDLTPDEVMKRIEDLIFRVIDQMKNNTLPVFKQNSIHKRFTPSQSRSLTSTAMVMAYCHSLLKNRRTNTTREVYYAYVTHFRSQRECDAVIQDCVLLLGVPRRCLGLKASPKGWFCGDIQIYQPQTDPSSQEDHHHVVDGTTVLLHASSQGIPIGNEWLERKKGFSISTKRARCLILIEKEGIYDRLCQDRFFDKYPCILATGKGFPDLATRAFAHTVHHELEIPVFGLCDHNPYGISVLNTYLYGSERRGVDGGDRFSVPIGWIGLRPSQVVRLQSKLPLQSLQRMTKRDLKRLNETLLKENHPWINSNDTEYRIKELHKMRELGYKVELEALNWIDADYCSKLLLEILEAYETGNLEEETLLII